MSTESMHATSTSYEDDSRDRSMLDLGASTIRLVTTAPTPPTPPSPPSLHPFTPTLESSDSPKSPLHCISNNEFTSAAASVLAEMNARLGLTGTSKEVGLDLFQKRFTQEIAPLPELQDRSRTDLTSMFDRAHERQFQKMEGLGEWYARRNAASLRKPVLQEISTNRKRKSDVLGDPPKRANGTATARARRRSKVITPGTRHSLIAAADAEDMDERKMKKVKISLIDGGDKKIGVAANNKSQDQSEEEDIAKSNEERERERAAIKKKLEISRTRRRSSMGRVSVGGRKPPLILNQAKKGMTSKFGFLSSAKSIVKNVWKGVGSGTLKQNSTMPLTRRSQATVPPAIKKNMPNVPAKSAPANKTSNPKAPVVKASTIKPDPNTSLRIPAKGIGLGRKISTKVGTNSTARTRSSTVSSGAYSISSSSVSGVPVGRRGAIPSFQQPFSLMSRTNSLASVGGTLWSSSGTGSSRGSTAANSIGLIKAGIPSSTRSSDVGNSSTNSVVAKRTSTLYAPTASSLAKMQGTVRPPSFSKAASRPSANALAKAQGQKPLVRDGLPSSPPPVGDGALLPNKQTGSIFSNERPNLSPSQGPATDASVSKPRAPPSRRPRISRSHVIARVGAQRAGSGSELTRTNSGRRSFNAPKTRSSLSVRVSGIGAKNNARHSAAMSTRKRLRQSEILRRRSKLSEVSPALLERDSASSEEDGNGSAEQHGASIDISMES